MADLDLDAIRARAEAATPGPWVTILDADEVWSLEDDGGYIEPSARIARVEAPDAEFIAAAREDVPALLDEVERVEGFRREAIEENRLWADRAERAEAEVERLRKVILRAALDEHLGGQP